MGDELFKTPQGNRPSSQPYSQLPASQSADEGAPWMQGMVGSPSPIPGAHAGHLAPVAGFSGPSLLGRPSVPLFQEARVFPSVRSRDLTSLWEGLAQAGGG